MFVGKMLGVLLGYMAGGIIGAIVGFFIGGMFDRAFAGFQQSESPEQLNAIQDTFFRTAFTLIGFLAKADGRVSEEEVQQTQLLMDQMGLTADHKREAIELFKTGASADFDPLQILSEFRTVCGHRPQLSQMILVYLVNTALSDGKFDSSEQSALRQLAEGLGYSRFAFEQLLRMILAQGAFQGGGYQRRASSAQSVDELAAAYSALGVAPENSDAEIKKAYRRLMSEYHPDKLMGQGVPADMIKAATERSQEVQTAYEVIKKARKS